ncbi:hypothetical protein P0Y43_06145 [Pseudomonas entomophila]|uniref:hypothetical protein n=1 Tax=Pseudomonas entomophila TaxID=312306 RepID=UPI0023D83C53|nr:hypothetical protein [Pseudomonas entomophila]MDF0730309.1 hypothetical protein [Pseudomonas entomophila]
MKIRIKLELASGQALEGMPLELLRAGRVVGRAAVTDGQVAFEVAPGDGALAVRVDRSILKG